MNLTELISNNRIISNQAIINNTVAESGNTTLSTADLLSSLTPGQTIQAQIVAREGNAVTLILPGDITMEAKLSGAMNLEAGKNVTFEVRGNNSTNLTLSPLFTNMATDANVSKALNMAGLSLSERNVDMTKQMMHAGMSISRESLSAMAQEVNKYMDYPVSDVIDLHRLGLPVNEENMAQIDGYKNLSYQIDDGMQDISKGLNELLINLTSSGDIENASKVFSGLLDIAIEDYMPADTTSAANASVDDFFAENLSIEKAALPSPEVNIVPLEISQASPESVTDEALSPAEKALKLLAAINNQENSINNQENSINNQENTISDSVKNSVKDSLNNAVNDSEKDTKGLINQKPIEPTNEDLLSSLKNLSLYKGEVSKDIDGFSILKQAFENAIKEGNSDNLKGLMSDKTIQDALFANINKQWSITPSQVADKENVKNLYERLNRQLAVINEALTSAGQKDSPVAAQTNNMGNNLDFLNQINQMYQYVQLPIRLSGGDNAHGDLYVYSNGKKLTGKEGKVSALLHLDMDNLGPVDVYVAMDNTGLGKKVSTQFYVQDDSILDFLESHMDELTKRLEDKGYSISCKMQLKNGVNQEKAVTESEGGGVNAILSQTAKINASEYSFDVRT